jgi:hypothetical protein
VAFLATHESGGIVFIDGQAVKIHPDHDVGFPPTFSEDGRVIAYRLTERKEMRSCVVFDGTAGPAFDAVGPPILSRDGKVVAYWAGKNDRYFLRIGDWNGPSFDGITDPAISADGTTVAYAAEIEDHWYLLAGGRKTPIPGHPYFVFISDDGKHLGWVDRAGLKMRVVFGGLPGEAFGIVGKPVISPIAPLVAYGAEEKDRKYVVIGTRKTETPDRISDPAFSPDGKSIGYGALIGRELWWKVLEVSAHR